MSILLANIPSIACVVFAGLLALNGNEWCFWFVIAGVVLYHLPTSNGPEEETEEKP